MRDGGPALQLHVNLLQRGNTMLAFHVIVSLIGLASGLVVFYGLLTGQPFGIWTAVFLATTVLTSATGFLLPSFDFDPARVVGTLSLVLLAAAVAALYAFHLAGAWRAIYVGTAVAALYLNVFVAITQAFQKLPFLQPLAPTQSEPPFLIAQIAVLIAFIVLGVLATRRFHPRAM
jgi:hypothetical protein